MRRLPGTQLCCEARQLSTTKNRRPAGPARAVTILLIHRSCFRILADLHASRLARKDRIHNTARVFEFRVMPFGLTNAPAVFQHLMQQVVTPLNPSSGLDFVFVYLDDILVFSRTLDQHIQHLKTVIDKLSGVSLKLKPSKCRFAQKELEYLGHVVSQGGLKTSPRLVEAVQQFPVPKSVHDVRRFLGLSSYCRKFIRNFAKIARPLHQLTCKNARFIWTPNCQSTFEELKEHLTTPPVLAYPCFQRDFVLETEASINGIGAVLGQYQDDENLHPVSYACRALSRSERNYWNSRHLL